jgi:hypothetical protein
VYRNSKHSRSLGPRIPKPVWSPHRCQWRRAVERHDGVHHSHWRERQHTAVHWELLQSDCTRALAWFSESWYSGKQWEFTITSVQVFFRFPANYQKISSFSDLIEVFIIFYWAYNYFHIFLLKKCFASNIMSCSVDK